MGTNLSSQNETLTPLPLKPASIPDPSSTEKLTQKNTFVRTSRYASMHETPPTHPLSNYPAQTKCSNMLV